MGFWAWFWIWTGLVVASLAVYALIGLSLFHRGQEVLHQLQRMAKPVSDLAAAIGPSKLEGERESDLLSDPVKLEQNRRNILNRKSKKRAARQRSLRTALKNIDVNESRFTDVR